ncbi:PAS domain-containing protein [Nodosilinea sp. E11]|uniref:PAS domain-containing protein n=1 Tax=Nodosilinea sp. E11 TaxID=3037479 RepID=UPI0029342BCF|nr:PAS domain-containing protein [Nodosilinea sp. E11]WOD40214.1 PAS domain-containing protein [Nodosilinea sp. E11]
MTTPERTVLLISDKQGQGKVYGSMLQKEGEERYRLVEHPYDGPLASLAQQPALCGILIDTHPSSVDGVDLLHRVQHQLQPACPPIILIGDDDLLRAVAALKAGAADYLVSAQITPAVLRRSLQTAQFSAAGPSPLYSHALADVLPQIVWLADAAGTITYWNPCWYEYTGQGADEALPWPQAGPLYPDDCDSTVAQWITAIAAGQSFKIEHRLRRHDGAYRWFVTRGGPTQNRDGQITGWAGTITDVHDQKQLEDRLRLVIQAVNGMVFDVSEVSLEAPDRVYRSEQLFNLIGVAAEQAPPTSSWWEDRIHPDDRARLKAYMAELFADDSQLYESEYRVRHQLGHWVDVWERGRLVRDLQGQVVRVVGSTVDISKQKAVLRDRNRAERQLREAHIQLESALAAGSVYTWRWNIPKNRVTANRSFAELFGLNPNRVAAGVRLEKFIGLIHPDDRERVTAAIKQAIATGDGCAAEFRIGYAGGETHWVIARGQVEYDSEGNAVAFPGALANISDRKRIEAALEQKIQEAEAGQQTLQALMEYIPEGITIADAPDVRIRQVSRYGQYLTGRTLDELGDIPYSDHPETWQIFGLDGTLAPPEALPLTRAVQQGEVVTNEEWLLQNAAGKTITILCNAGPIYNQTGDVTGGIIAWRDITELKQNAKILKRNQEHLSLAMAAAKMGSFDWNIQTGEVRFSENLKTLFGLAPDSLNTYETVIGLVHPDDLQSVQQALHRAVYQREEYNVELRVIRPDGTVCWIMSLGKVFYSATDTPSHMTGIDIDITDRKQAELNLQQATERLNVALKSAPITLFNQDLDLRYTWIYNPTLGLSVDDVIGKRDVDLGAPETAAHLTQLKRQVIATGVTVREEVKIVTNGQVGYYDLTIDPIRDGEQGIVGITCAAVDISERVQIEAERQRAITDLRESEDRLRMAIESAQMGTWDWNLTTNVLTWNAGCKAIFGLPPEADISIERFFEGLHPDDRDRIRQIVQAIQTVSSGGKFNVEYRILVPQAGAERWVKAKGQVYFAADGTPLRFLGTVLDITPQKRAEAERERLLQQERLARTAAERANRIKDEFLAILSHELRSPLNPILGWAKLLQTKKMDADKTARALATIERNAKLQTQLIDDLLDIAKILRGKLKIEPAPVDPVFIIEAAIETVQSAADAKAIHITTDLHDLGPLQGDGARLQQIVWNLLTNAVKFTPENGRIDLQLRQVDHWAELKVTDTGRGIGPEFLPHIFDSFCQEDTSITRQFGGLGLGLAIVRYLVEAHGGTIVADSPGEGQGATFTVKLPLLSSRPSYLAPRASAKPIDLTGVRVMAIDDNPDALALLTLLLEEYGAEVTSLTSAADALSTLIRFQPDVVVSDIGMPHLDGYGLMRQIRALPVEQGGQVKAIALTAYVRDEDAQKALDSGFQRHLSKPIEPETVVLAIADLLDRP